MTTTTKCWFAAFLISLHVGLFGSFGGTLFAVEGTIVAIALLIAGLAIIAEKAPMLGYFLFLGFLQD